MSTILNCYRLLVKAAFFIAKRKKCIKPQTLALPLRICGLSAFANGYFNCAHCANIFAFAIQFSTFNKLDGIVSRQLLHDNFAHFSFTLRHYF